MNFFTHIVSKLFSAVFVMALIIVGNSALAQNHGKLSVKGELLCDKKDKSIMSSVTVYRYYHQSKSVELMEQQMVARNGKFKFNIEFDKDYIIDVASNTGVHKRIHMNTEVVHEYKYDNQQFEFEVDLLEGDMENPEEVAWIYFDPSVSDFSHTNQMPMAFEGR